MLISIINYLAVATIFSGGLVFRTAPMDFGFSYIAWLILMMFFLGVLRRIYVNKTFALLFGMLIFFSVYNVVIGHDGLVLLLKQIIGIGFSSTIFYTLVKMNSCDIEKLFAIYLKFAFVLAAIGIFQEFSYLIHFQIGYEYNFLPAWKLYHMKGGLLRVNSFLPEPAAFCYVMIPAFFTAVAVVMGSNVKFLNKYKSWIVISSVILSFSATGYLGILISIFLIFYNYGKIKHVLLGTIIILILALGAYTKIQSIKLRIDDSIQVLTGKKPLYYSNLSTFTLYSNAIVAYSSFKDNPFFGSGLGSHKISYSRFIGEVISKSRVTLNREDANSLFLRLLSETGLLGVSIVLYFIYKFHGFRKNDTIDYFWIVNNAVLSMFVIRLLRGGHYFNGGLFFFVWIYYFSKRIMVRGKL